jgi:hypothetical protein
MSFQAKLYPFTNILVKSHLIPHPFAPLYNLEGQCTLKGLLGLTLTKRYIILNKEVLYAWKYPKANPTINNYYLEVYKD